MRSRGTGSCSHGRRCFSMARRQISLRWKVVDSGATTRINAIRSRKNSCSATVATVNMPTRRPRQRSRAARLRSRRRPSTSRRSAVRTGKVSGRTPNQTKYASAACSTSMPSPSRAIAPCARAHCRKGPAAAPYIMSSASAPGRSVPAGSGGTAACRLAAVALINTSKSWPGESSGATDSGTSSRAALAAKRSISVCAFAPVRFATTSVAGRAPSSGSSAPPAAPPAPSSSTRLPRRLTPALPSMSRTRPAPSVLSPSQPSASNEIVLTAPARRARSVSREQAANASPLNGTVTLQPCPPPSANARTVATNWSNGDSMRV